MKIAILTQPLHDNYGGLLQAYALKETLKTLGHNPIIVNRHGAGSNPIRRELSKLKNKLLLRPARLNQYLNYSQRALISERTLSFRTKYIPELSELITTNKGMKSLLLQNIDAFIVGSDQCWRPRYSPCITNYFLDFIKEQNKIKRIAYAASFGTAEWEFNKQQTQKCKNLISLFDAISVREDDGVTLVKDYLGRNDAIHVLDPTMLLDITNYNNITENEKIGKSKGNLKVYILDKSPEKETFIQKTASKLNLKPFEVMPKLRLKQEVVNDQNAKYFQYPCPSQWLKGFQDAEFVITDSFHGTVFSILYNKPFIVLGNKRRGMSRFTSLLKMFGLENRLVLELEEKITSQLLSQEINWGNVNEILEKERNKALNFLVKSLE